MTLSNGGTDDRGALMRQWLIQLYMRQPFAPFVIRLESGFEVRVPSPELLVLEPGVLVAAVHATEDSYEVCPVDRIVSLRTLA